MEIIFLINKSEENKIKGFTLIELLVAVAIISIIAVSLFGLFNRILRFVQVKRIRSQAAMVATEQMEVIHNLSYDDVGTIAGIPSGVLPQEHAVTRGSILFSIETDVRYIDDPFDGILGASPDDSLNIDYKQIKITTSWETPWDSDSMFFLSSIAPKGIESASGGGTLKINVFNASGLPVPQADVDIINPTAGVNLMDLKTNNNGLILLPGSPADLGSYRITVDKSNYSQARTYGIDDPLGNIVPDPAHLVVTAGNTSEASFAIAVPSDLIVQTRIYNPFGVPLAASATFWLRGSKIIGEFADGTPIYKYDDVVSTDNLGFETLEDLEWDSYSFDFNEGASLSYNIMAYDPPTNPLTILPGATYTIQFTLFDPYSPFSLLITLTDENSDPLIGASVEIFEVATTYTATLISGDTGQTFFDDLNNVDYDLIVTFPAYTDINSTITVDGNLEEKLQMFPI